LIIARAFKNTSHPSEPSPKIPVMRFDSFMG
jgi:hypothetical protein